jgi:hypothetical protein
MLMRFRGGGVGHTSTRTATDRFLQDRDRLDRDNSLTQIGDDPDASEDGFDGDDVDEAMDKEGDGDNSLESEHIQSSRGDDNDLGGGNGGDDGEGLGGGDEEPGTGDIDDEGRNGDEEEDYGYRYLVDEDSDEEDSDDDEPLDVADDALGPEDGEGDADEVNLLGFAAF